MDWVVEVNIPNNDPNLSKVDDERGRDVYVYEGNVNLNCFHSKIYNI